MTCVVHHFVGQNQNAGERSKSARATNWHPPPSGINFTRGEREREGGKLAGSTFNANQRITRELGELWRATYPRKWNTFGLETIFDKSPRRAPHGDGVEQNFAVLLVFFFSFSRLRSFLRELQGCVSTECDLILSRAREIYARIRRGTYIVEAGSSLCIPPTRPHSFTLMHRNLRCICRGAA